MRPDSKSNPALGFGGFKLGTVTYNLAKDWDIPTLIKNCAQAGFEAVELRTTHRHGVEPSLSKEQRAEVREAFINSPVYLLSLGQLVSITLPMRRSFERTLKRPSVLPSSHMILARSA